MTGLTRDECQSCDKDLTEEQKLRWNGFCSRACGKEFKAIIRERDRHACVICWQFGNHVHHINYDGADNVPENCITLCKSCHPRINGNRKYWENRLKRAARDRERGIHAGLY